MYSTLSQEIISLSYIIIIIICITQSDSQQVTISINPDTIYIESSITVTCGISVEEKTFFSLVPFFIINGTTIPHSCLGSSEYQPLTQRVSPLPHNSDNLASMISLQQVSISDNGLKLACAFYNLESETYLASETISLSIINTTQQTSTPTRLVPTLLVPTPGLMVVGFFKEFKLYLIGGAVTWVIMVLLLAIGVSLCVLGCYLTRNQTLVRVQYQAGDGEKYTQIKSDETCSNNSDSIPEKMPL